MWNLTAFNENHADVAVINKQWGLKSHLETSEFAQFLSNQEVEMS